MSPASSSLLPPSSTSPPKRSPCPPADAPPPDVRVPASHRRPRARLGHRRPRPCWGPPGPVSFRPSVTFPRSPPPDRRVSRDPAQRTRPLRRTVVSSRFLRVNRSLPSLRLRPGLAPARLPRSPREPEMSLPPGSPPRRAPPPPAMRPPSRPPGCRVPGPRATPPLPPDRAN